MNGRVLLVAALLVAALLRPAASPAATLVAQGGYSRTEVRSDDPDFRRAGLSSGTGVLGVEIPVRGALALVPEIGYGVRGYSNGHRFVVGGDGVATISGEALQTLGVLTMGLPVAASFPAAAGLQCHVLTGPVWQTKLGERIVARSGSQGAEPSHEMREGPVFGWLGAVRLDAPAGPGRLGLGTRYTHGLGIASKPGFFPYRMRTLEFVAGYSIRVR
jgi:hypothetical protein